MYVCVRILSVSIYIYICISIRYMRHVPVVVMEAADALVLSLPKGR